MANRFNERERSGQGIGVSSVSQHCPECERLERERERLDEQWKRDGDTIRELKAQRDALQRQVEAMQAALREMMEGWPSPSYMPAVWDRAHRALHGVDLDTHRAQQEAEQ